LKGGAVAEELRALLDERPDEFPDCVQTLEGQPDCG
jgi:hypothetical protein